MSYMKRSTAVFTLLAVIGSTACGTSKEDGRSRNSQSEDGQAVQVADDEIQFEINAPSDGLELHSIQGPVEKPGAELWPEHEEQEEPSPVEPTLPGPIEPTLPPVQSNRISISCKESGARLHSPQARARFLIGLEERDGQTVGYESIDFLYNCDGGALVKIKGLRSSASYTVDARYINTAGVLTHTGKTESFRLGPQGSVRVKLFMTKVKREDGGVVIDVIFDDKASPGACSQEEVVCASIYAPVICTGTAAPLGGQEIALLLEEVKAENECVAQAQLRQLACAKYARLIQYQCKAVKIN